MLLLCLLVIIALFDAVVKLINTIELREKLGREGIKTAKSLTGNIRFRF